MKWIAKAKQYNSNNNNTNSNKVLYYKYTVSVLRTNLDVHALVSSVQFQDSVLMPTQSSSPTRH